MREKYKVKLQRMNKYDPCISPDPEEWLALSEDDRLDLVREYHEKSGELPEGSSMEAHAAIHAVVENQVAMNIEPVTSTVAKLIRQGLKRHEAVHAVGAVLSGEIWELQQKGEVGWNASKYRRKLEKLTVKRWRKGQW